MSELGSLSAPVAAWLSSKELAALAGIIQRNARDACKCCYEGGKWRGHALEVQKKNGKAYEVHAPSLPPDLFDKWLESQPKPPAPVQAPAPTQLPATLENRAEKLASSKALEEAKWKRWLIEDALAHPARSRERGSVIKDIAALKHTKPCGKIVRIAERTLFDWIERFENDGLQGIVRKRRHDGPRVLITQKWDAACPLPDGIKGGIAAAIDKYIVNQWRSANPGWCYVADHAQSMLMELSRKAGWPDATLENCKLTRAAVEKHRQYGLVHIAEKDAKRLFDDYRPRTRRKHSLLLPMQEVVGDVHPLDVVVLREDGTPATPRFIAWYDVATHRLTGTLILLDQGTGVTQADVWASFAAMVEKWGYPERLYLDNGREYNGRPRRYAKGAPDAAIEGLNTLSALVLAMREFTDALRTEFTAELRAIHDPDRYLGEPNLEYDTPVAPELRGSGVTRAQPYNAPGKTGIEGEFAALEKVLAKLPIGYIGGNRMKKKTPKLGKQTAPWPSMEKFKPVFDEFLKSRQNQRQAGNLDGKSPNEALKAAQDAGWQASSVPREALIYAMSETRECMVHRGGVEVDGQRYEGDALIPLSRRKIKIRVAKWATDRIMYAPDLENPREVAWIERVRLFHPLDEAGAREAARRNGVLRKHIGELKAGTEQLDSVAEMARDNAARPPAPETIFGPVVSFGPQIDALVESAKRLGPPAPQEIIPLNPGESVDRETGEVTNFLSRSIPGPITRRTERKNPLDTFVQNPKKQGAGR
jgi:hypothetical protein